ncbi:hypothetical protein J6590_059909 [Homalodisca vitripennis]|nr:hypothetical protein J6590_059909 [Homalodisca vitripennis]
MDQENTKYMPECPVRLAGVTLQHCAALRVTRTAEGRDWGNDYRHFLLAMVGRVVEIRRLTSAADSTVNGEYMVVSAPRSSIVPCEVFPSGSCSQYETFFRLESGAAAAGYGTVPAALITLMQFPAYRNSRVPDDKFPRPRLRQTRLQLLVFPAYPIQPCRCIVVYSSHISLYLSPPPHSLHRPVTCILKYYSCVAGQVRYWKVSIHYANVYETHV